MTHLASTSEALLVCLSIVIGIISQPYVPVHSAVTFQDQYWSTAGGSCTALQHMRQEWARVTWSSRTPTQRSRLHDYWNLFFLDLSPVFKHVSQDTQFCGRTMFKPIHAKGAVARILFHTTNHTLYTGVLSSPLSRGILRISSALLPSAKGVVPAFAVKLFPTENGLDQSTILTLGSMQRNNTCNYFGTPMATEFSEDTVPSIVNAKARQVSQFPTKLGVSNLARTTTTTSEQESVEFPNVLTLVPAPCLLQYSTIDCDPSKEPILHINSAVNSCYTDDSTERLLFRVQDGKGRHIASVELAPRESFQSTVFGNECLTFLHQKWEDQLEHEKHANT